MLRRGKVVATPGDPHAKCHKFPGDFSSQTLYGWAMSKVTHLSVGEGGARGRQAHLREVSGEADAPLGTVGQELRGARISRGEDLVSISRILKIRREHLDALEEDNLSALPGRTYAVGFIRAYAEYLGLNPARTVERFKTEIAGRDEVSPTAGFKEDEEVPGLSWGWIFIALIVLAVLGYGAYDLFISAGSQNSPSVAAVPSQMVEKAPRPKPHRLAAAPLKPVAAPVPAAPTAGTAAPPHTPVQPAPGGELFGKWNLNPRIVLQITQPTRILVQDEDGKVYINRILHPGDIYQVANHTGLSLTAEHANAVVVNIDGKPAGTLGNSPAAIAALPLDFDKIAAAHGAGGRAPPKPATQP
jgi:cytoskeleton protein RodZ